MSDLRTQLAAAFGRSDDAAPEASPTTAAPVAASTTRPSVLDHDAHLRGDWHRRLRQLAGSLSRPPALSESPKLARARMVTDQVVKALKKEGRKREARELAALRDDFLARRERAAWGAVKARFSTLGLSMKAYRAIKQGGADPVRVLAVLDRRSDAELVGMGAARLRELLG